MRLARGSLIFVALVAVSGWLVASSGSSAPRVAYHPEGNFTRIVLEAPSNTKFTPSQSGKTLTVRLEPFASSAQSGASDTPQLATWRLEPQGKATLLRLQTRFELKSNSSYKLFSLPAGGGLPNRLVIDLGPQLGSSNTGSSAATPIGTRTPKRPKLTVVIDPGHGGIDSGAVGFVMEKEVTLDVGLKVRAALEAAGVSVIMTRNSDAVQQSNASLSEKRRDLDFRADMGSTDRNAFVSIHVNSAASVGAHGVETYLFGRSPDAETLAQAERENGGGSVGKAITGEARNVARDLLNDQLAQLNASFSRRLASDVQSYLVGQTGALNLGVKQAEFWVIRKPRIPAILVEIGFANHPAEGRSLGTPAYRQRVAQGIARGVLRFLGL